MQPGTEVELEPAWLLKPKLVRVEQEYDAGTMRALLTGVLLLAATSAWAEWVKVTETSDTAFYVDPASIGDKGPFRQVSVLQDYAGQEPGGVRSRQVLYEIDCAGERLRSLAVSEHPEPMAQGGRVSSLERESVWLYVAPRTGSNIASQATYRTILRYVCAQATVPLGR